MIMLAPADYEHALMLAPSVRRADIDELWDGYRVTPLEAMASSIKASFQSWAGTVDGEPIAVAGVYQPDRLKRSGHPWMIGSKHLERKDLRREFLVTSKDILCIMLESFDYLENHVDARNTKAISWLKWLGFTVEEAKPFGPDGLPFHHFWMRG